MVRSLSLTMAVACFVMFLVLPQEFFRKANVNLYMSWSSLYCAQK